MVDLENLELKYFCNGFDVPYKLQNGGILNIKPILVKDYPYYEYSSSILEIRKNETDNIEIIKMSYLDFLLNIVISKDEYKDKLINLCNLCFGYDYISVGRDKNGKSCLYLCNKDGEIEKIISSKEFDDISKIILNQNNYSYDNRYIAPEVRELMMEYYKVKYSNLYTPTLEQKKAFVSSKMGMPFKELNELTYREFDLIYNASVESEIYIGQKIIQGSYKYEVKEDIRHPLFEQKKDPYAEIFEDTSVLGNKGISGANQLNNMNIE